MVEIYTDYITLGQFLKMADLVSSGAHVKQFLMDEKLYVNGVLENRRGRKLYDGDIILYNQQEYQIKKI